MTSVAKPQEGREDYGVEMQVVGKFNAAEHEAFLQGGAQLREVRH